MVAFFDETAVAKDRLYTDIVKAPNRYLRKARRLTERMWTTCGQFVDANAQVRAWADDFYPVWWELYLAYALSEAGISLVPTKEHPLDEGRGRPDLLANGPRVWIEAVMPQAGAGADALIEPRPKQCSMSRQIDLSFGLQPHLGRSLGKCCNILSRVRSQFRMPQSLQSQVDDCPFAFRNIRFPTSCAHYAA